MGAMDQEKPIECKIEELSVSLEGCYFSFFLSPVFELTMEWLGCGKTL